MGDSLFMNFWPYWLSDLALQHSAVIISPNYRLMPEATSSQIYEDIEDFWQWLHSSALTSLLAGQGMPIELDLSRILTAGDSAGGLLSVILALSHPDELRAATATYPAVDIGSSDYSKPRADPPFGKSIHSSVIDNLNASIGTSPTVKSSDSSISRLEYMLAVVEHGKLGQLYARDMERSSYGKILYPMQWIEKGDIKLPRGGITIAQGRQDSVVPLAGVAEFVQRANEATERGGGGEVTLTVREGDHGFDVEERLTETWLQNMLKAPINSWLE